MLLLGPDWTAGASDEVTIATAAGIQQYFDRPGDRTSQWFHGHYDIVWTSGAIFRPTGTARTSCEITAGCSRRCGMPARRSSIPPDGNYTEFIDDTSRPACTPWSWSRRPTWRTSRRRYGDRVAFIGNADTRILLFGQPGADPVAEVERCIGRSARSGPWILPGRQATTSPQHPGRERPCTTKKKIKKKKKKKKK